jgi:hypothetical protein
MAVLNLVSCIFSLLCQWVFTCHRVSTIMMLRALNLCSEGKQGYRGKGKSNACDDKYSTVGDDQGHQQGHSCGHLVIGINLYVSIAIARPTHQSRLAATMHHAETHFMGLHSEILT